jgi:acetyl esterase/lipase
VAWEKNSMQIRMRYWAVALLVTSLGNGAHGITVGDSMIAWWRDGSHPLLDAIRARRGQGSDDMDGRGVQLRGEVRLPPGARLLRDRAYGSNEQQKLDVYIPPRARVAPIIMMVHGGAWVLGDKSYLPVVKAKVAYWLPKGYILVSVNYRMSHSPDVMGEADDVARALAYVQAHATGWGGDPKHLVLMGHSAGAHLIALLAAAPAIGAAYGVKPWLGTIVLDSASLNVVQTMEGQHFRLYDRAFGSNRTSWAEVSPFQRLSRKPAPMLLVCSTRRNDSCPQAQEFAAKVRRLGGRATVLPVDMKHGVLNTVLGEPSKYTTDVEGFIRSLGLP